MENAFQEAELIEASCLSHISAEAEVRLRRRVFQRHLLAGLVAVIPGALHVRHLIICESITIETHRISRSHYGNGNEYYVPVKYMRNRYDNLNVELIKILLIIKHSN